LQSNVLLYKTEQIFSQHDKVLMNCFDCSKN